MLQLIKRIPQNTKVCLFGAGTAGRFVKDHLEIFRSDVQIIGFIDSFKSGYIDKIPIFKPDVLAMLAQEIDVLIITSMFVREIEQTLQTLGINNYIVFDTAECKQKITLSTLDGIKKGARIGLWAEKTNAQLLHKFVNCFRKDIKLSIFSPMHDESLDCSMTIQRIKNVKGEKECDFIMALSDEIPDLLFLELIENNLWPIVMFDKQLICFLKQYFDIEREELPSLHYWSEEEYSHLQTPIKSLESLFHDNKDRELLQAIFLTRRKSGSRSTLFNYYFKNNWLNYRKQYTEYLSFNNIHVVIDGGGYDGGTSQVFSRMVGEMGRVYCFEPLWQEVEQIVNQNDIANWQNIKFISLGLWKSRDRLNFVNCGPASRVVDESTVSFFTETPHSIEVIDIDSFVKENDIPKIDLIKLDIEGAELAALEGAVDTLHNHRPQLAISIYHHKNDLFAIPLFLKSQLKNYKFRLGHYTPHHCETVLYAIPNEKFQ